jgi:demethylmenaquinone methyltransferase / 2-methoxy-6-polyprenyl-1,4-benzoquinol methylase
MFEVWFLISKSTIKHQPSDFQPVGAMFDRIAPTYDLLNHLLSAGRDYAWRRRMVRQIRGKGALHILDLATGTGDLLLSLLRECPNTVKATGLDISERMLAVCREKLRRRGLQERVELVCGDAAATPFSEGSFDAVTMAFGIRNTADITATLAEIHRILKPGGMALILEFSLPPNRLVRWGYLKYLRSVVPWIGRAISGDRHAYRYLDTSIEAFHQPQAFCGLLQRAGFHEISAIPLTFGVASIYRGTK